MTMQISLKIQANDAARFFAWWNNGETIEVSVLLELI
jgi:hypothetical protein